MKLIITIAIGVFLGTVAAQLVLDSWHSHQSQLALAAEQQRLAEQEKARLAQAEKIRALFSQSQQPPAQTARPPAGFIPDDASAPTHP